MAQERLTIDDLLTTFGKVVVSLVLLLLVAYLVSVQLHLVKLDNKVFPKIENVPTAVPTIASPSAEIASPTASPTAKLAPAKTLLRGTTPTVFVTVAPTTAVRK